MWCEEEGEVREIAIDYFKRLFKSQGMIQSNEIVDAVGTKVTDEMNSKLLEEFTTEEIQIALHQMHPTKTPGPDVMPALFFQKYWSTISHDITHFCLEFLNKNKILDEINQTTIVLIPKNSKPDNDHPLPSH